MDIEQGFNNRAAHLFDLFRVEYLVVLLVGLNLLDCVVTFRALSLGASEVNPIVLAMGGPLAPINLVLKLVFLPALGVALIPIFYRCTEKRLLHSMLFGIVVYYLFALAENVWVVLTMPNSCPV